MEPPSLTYLVSGVGGHNPGLSWTINWILSHGLTRWFELFWARQLATRFWDTQKEVSGEWVFKENKVEATWHFYDLVLEVKLALTPTQFLGEEIMTPPLNGRIVKKFSVLLNPLNWKQTRKAKWESKCALLVKLDWSLQQEFPLLFEFAYLVTVSEQQPLPHLSTHCRGG